MVRLVSVPSFTKTSTIVLVNLKTLVGHLRGSKSIRKKVEGMAKLLELINKEEEEEEEKHLVSRRKG